MSASALPPPASLLERLHSLPALPVVVTKISQMLSDPRVRVAHVAEVLRQDQALTARVLRLVNSPYYGVPSEVSNVGRALAFLGFNTVAQIVLSVGVFSALPMVVKTENIWKHALAVAVCAKELAKGQSERLQAIKPEDVFTCGLLHDIGKIALHEIDPGALSKVMGWAQENSESFHAAELHLEFTTHTTLGAALAEKWQLPVLVQLVLKHHHDDLNSIKNISPEQKVSIEIVTQANELAREWNFGHSGNYAKTCVAMDEVQKSNLLKKVSTELERAASLLGGQA